MISSTVEDLEKSCGEDSFSDKVLRLEFLLGFPARTIKYNNCNTYIRTYVNSLIKNPINLPFAEKLRKIWTQNTEGAGVFWLENVILSVLSMSI